MNSYMYYISLITVYTHVTLIKSNPFNESCLPTYDENVYLFTFKKTTLL